MTRGGRDPRTPPILETALYAGDLDAAEAFYGGVLGLARIARAGARHVFYRWGRASSWSSTPRETEVADPASPLRCRPTARGAPATSPSGPSRSASTPGASGCEAAGIAIESRCDLAAGRPVDLRPRPGRQLGRVGRGADLGRARWGAAPLRQGRCGAPLR